MRRTSFAVGNIPNTQEIRTTKKGSLTMKNKKDSSRFTIQFNKHNPLHMRVAETLNALKPRSKAPYVVEAILYYESCGAPEIDISEVFDKKAIDDKAIEATIYRVLLDMQKSGNDMPAVPALATPCASTKQTHHLNSMIISAEDINYDDSLEALSGDAFDAISAALESLRRK